MSGPALLDQLQQLLAGINDVPVTRAVSDFHLGERARCSLLLGRALDPDEDEQVLLSESAGAAELSVYVDVAVLDRLQQCNPLRRLDETNLGDFCTALEGVSHFHYLVWCIDHQRQLSMLELELQGEVDKYAAAVCLLRRQGRDDLPRGLRRRLFDEVSFVTGLPAELLHRYEEANRSAARFCQRLERQFLCRQRFHPEAWLRTLREFYRRPHHQKLSYALR